MAAVRNNRRRRRSRGRAGPLFKLLCVLALLFALTVGVTVFFRVEVVEVTGNSRYTREEVVEASGIEMGDNLYGVNKNQMYRQILQALPYVEGVSMWRELPNAIVIRVIECQAAAQVAAPSQLPAAQPGEEGDAAQEMPLEAAREPWLISAAGKLLEPAPADSTAMVVTGITPLVPRAGSAMQLPKEEDAKKAALLSLLSALKELELMDNVSSVELGDIQIKLRYRDRFDVKLPLNGDFLYQLRVLEKGVEETVRRHGEEAAGTMDLTQKDYELIYSPSQEPPKTSKMG